MTPHIPDPNSLESILVVDDDLELCELVTEYLEGEGFQVDTVHRGRQGLERALSNAHSLVVLDVMLPELSGLEVLKGIRAQSQIPVLMLTARGEEVDRIIGLEVGADDYLPKPFNPRELLARIRAILRRVHPDPLHPVPPRPERLCLNDIQLDMGSHTVVQGDHALELTSVEFDLLALFLRNAGRVIEREEMVQKVLDRPYSPYDRSIDMHVSNLRRKIGPHPGGGERIKSVRSVGYIYTFSDPPSER